MVQYKAINPHAKVSGDAILAMVEGLGGFKNFAVQILEENRIKDPQKINGIYNKAG